MGGNILISGVNWLGDSVMSMPALQLFKQKNPSCRLTMMVKSKLLQIWQMHPAIDEVVELEGGVRGVFVTARELRKRSFDSAFIFPNSFRSALVPYLAGIPRRHGVPGQLRSLLLSDHVKPVESTRHAHQMWEYVDILGLENVGKLPENISLKLPDELIKRTFAKAGCDRNGKYISVLPGAAHGPAKRWPTDCFVEVCRYLSRQTGLRILVLGSRSEMELCAGIASEVGGKTLNLAGSTTLMELAAILRVSKLAITNDSGGMHLAAAVGTGVVSVFGATDAAKTGPIGTRSRVIVADGFTHSRDIEPDSLVAKEALFSIPPARVISAAMELLKISGSKA